jgi:hypothetical protein
MAITFPPAATVAGGATTVNLGSAVLDVGNGLVNTGASTLSELSTLVLDSGDPGMPDLDVDADAFFFEITDSIDWSTVAWVVIDVSWSACTNDPSGTYSICAGLHGSTTLTANGGQYGGFSVDNGATGLETVGSSLVYGNSAAAANTGGGFSIIFQPSEEDSKFRDMSITSWAGSATGRTNRQEDPSGMSISNGDPLYGFVSVCKTASGSGCTVNNLKVRYQIVDRPA